MFSILAEDSATIVQSFDFSVTTRAIILIAIAAWASLLAHKGISNFNDGARPVFPELIEKRMSRPEFAMVVTGMGIGWVLAGFTQWIGTGLIAAHLILIATDIIGAWSPNPVVALILGGLYGALAAFGTNLINAAFAALPYNFLNDLTQITTPVLPIFALYPAIAIANQFDAKKGLKTAIWEAVIYVACSLIGKLTIGSVSISLYPYSFAMLAGMIFLVVYSVKASKNQEAIKDEEQENIFTKNAERIKSNWPYLCVQGALNALGIRTLAMAYQPYILAPCVLGGDYSAFYIAMIGVIIAFIPLIVSTSLSTGVYQAVGLTTCMLVGRLAPTWWLAPIFGFAVEFLELQLLGLLGKWLSRYPELSRSGDHIRNAMVETLNLALLCGSFLAANATWSGIGIMLVGGAYLLNEVLGQKIPRTAIGPMSAACVGIIYNIFVALGWIVLAS